MSKDKAKSLSDLIGASHSPLGHLAESASRRSELSQYLRTRLDPDLAGGFLHCNIHDDETLVVVASSPEWASRLRFSTKELLALCQEFGEPAARVKVKVALQSGR